jgi:hypothetical protein
VEIAHLPINHVSLKLITALIGLITVLFVYFLGREAYNKEIGLLAAFFAAVGMWPVALARVGLRFPLTPVMVAPALFFILRALKRNHLNDWLLSGFLLGAGLYGYSSFRVMPVLVIFLIALKLLLDRQFGSDAPAPMLVRGAPVGAGASSAGVSRFFYGAIVAIILSLMVFAPLGRYMIDQPEMFWYRVLRRTTGAEQPLPQDLVAVFVNNVKNALLMFNWQGDIVWVNTIPNKPVLDEVTGALFLIGAVLALARLIRRREAMPAYLLTSLFVLLLPSILSLSFPGENPSVVRAGGAFPIVFILAALPPVLLGRRIAQVLGKSAGRVVVAVLLAAMLVLTIGLNLQRYFVEYERQYRLSAINSSEMAAVIRGFDQSVGTYQNAFVKTWPYWVDTRLIGIQLGDLANVHQEGWSHAVDDLAQIESHKALSGNKLYILHIDDHDAVAKLLAVYPQGQLMRHVSPTPNKDFLVFFVPE